MEVISVKPVLFEADSTNFDNNGIGVLYDAESCTVTEEHNGVFDLELEYPASGDWYDFIEEKRIILAKPNDVDEPHAFRIYEIDKSLLADAIVVKATSITDDLAGNLIPNVVVTDVTPQQALNTIKQNLIEPTIFDFVSDIQTVSSSEWTRVNPLQAIAGVDGSLVDIWGGDIKRTNNTVYLYSRRGTDKVTVIRPEKNIEGFEMTVSTKGVITKILPFYTYTPEPLPEYEFVLDSDGNTVKQQVYSEDLEQLPVTLFGDVVVSDNASLYPVQYYSPVDYSANEYVNLMVDDYIQAKKDADAASPTIPDNSGWDAELQSYILSLVNDEANGYFIYNNPGSDEPSVQITVDMVELADSSDWEKFKNLETIQVSDTVDVYVKKFNVDVEVSIQTIVYDSIGERVINIVAGNPRNNLTDSITKSYKKVTKELEDYIENMENGVYNTINRTADGQSRKFQGYTEPPASISTKGDLWFKEVGGGKIESYIYDGGVWVQVIGDEAIQSMNQAISNAQSTADSAASQADATATDINNVVTTNGFTTLADLIASKVSDGDFSTLYFQESEKIGLMFMVNGVAESIIMIDGTTNTPYIKGEHIILDGNTVVDGTFTVTDTMLAADAVINRLKATGIDAQDVSIINLDAASITGGDLQVTETFRIMHNGTPVLEVDAATGQVKITAPNLATQTDLENIEVGGRNLLRASYDYYPDYWIRDGVTTLVDEYAGTMISSTTTDWSSVDYPINDIVNRGLAKVGDELTYSAYARLIGGTGKTLKFYLASNPKNDTNVGTLTDQWQKFSITFTLTQAEITANDAIKFETFGISGLGIEFQTAGHKLEKGNVGTDHTFAPEDIQTELGEKASNTDLENLAGIVSDVQLDLDGKTDVGQFQALKDDYDARMAQDIIDKDQLKTDLATIEGRTTLVETIAGNNKIVTEFLETVITEAEEGIYISNRGSNTGILISSDRISFMDNDIEVAYISNKTMQINHGIFVESATISDFKFEKIPGTTILGITWVGV